VSAAGCGGARAGIEQSNAPSGARVITADAIAASGAKTGWDAVRLTVPNVQLREVRGQPARIQRRGRASLYQDDQVRVILDHVPIDDLQVLKQVAAADILTIEILTGLDATTHYGATSTSGVIVITTTSGRP
jgi:outer membrane cobalamin receptor